MEKLEFEYTDLIESRIDRYIRSIYPLMSNGLLQKYLRKKYILLNNKKIDCSHQIKTLDRVSVPWFFKELYQEDEVQINYSGPAIILAEKLLKDYLVFSNDDFIVINKPSRLATQGGTDIKLSIDHALSFLNKESKEYRIVHRLDKDTSGLLIIASCKDAARMLTMAFRDKKIKKQYKAILYGELKARSGWVIDGIYKENFIFNDDLPYETITKFEVLSQNGNYYYIKLEPITGKKHQLRIDMDALGAPVVGDVKYNGANEYNLMLHAEKLNISSDIFGKEFHFETNLPQYFINFLKDQKLY